MKREQQILADRVCKRLADLAHEMAHDRLGTYKDMRAELLTLRPNDFQVMYDLLDNQAAPDMLRRIENTVNTNTSQFVRELYGTFSFGNDFLGMFENEVSLVTFDPAHCTDSKRQYAALMVAQRFESLIENSMGKNGRLYPAGTFIGHYYGVIQSPDFPAFAYIMNGVLGRHALPEDKLFLRVQFDTPRPRGPWPQP